MENALDYWSDRDVQFPLWDVTFTGKTGFNKERAVDKIRETFKVSYNLQDKS